MANPGENLDPGFQFVTIPHMASTSISYQQFMAQCDPGFQTASIPQMASSSISCQQFMAQHWASVVSQPQSSDKLGTINYKEWAMKMNDMFFCLDLEEYLQEPVGYENLLKDIQWRKKYIYSKILLRRFMSEKYGQIVSDCDHPWEMLVRLKTMFSNSLFVDTYEAFCQLQSLKMGGNYDMFTHISEMQSCFKKLAEVNSAYHDFHKVSVLLYSLPERYADFRDFVKDMDDTQVTWENVSNKLLIYSRVKEQGM